MKSFLLFFAFTSLFLGGCASSDKDFYSLTANDITGKAIDFSQYRGKVRKKIITLKIKLTIIMAFNLGSVMPTV